MRLKRLILSVAAVFPLAASAVEQSELQFRVLLDDREIGYHRYRLEDRPGDVRTVESEARFDVKFLFFNAYSYRHSLTSRWDGKCLQSLSSRTDANGKELKVEAELRQDDFVVKTGDGVDELPECVMDFAYWDPRILEQSRLLNPQTGEYVDVSIEPMGQEAVVAGGREIPANAYRITARDLRIDVWYSQDEKRWLALESLAKGGRVLRYELT